MRMRHSCFEASQNVISRSAALPSRILPRRHRLAPGATSTLTTTVSKEATGTPINSQLGAPSCGGSPLPSRWASVSASPPHDVPRCLTIITGASRGLGAAIARTLTANGPPLPTASPGAYRLPGTPVPSAGATALVEPRCEPDLSATSLDQEEPSYWVHDLVLLATDPVRLREFVRGELGPILEQQQRQQKRPRQAAARNAAPDLPDAQGCLQPTAAAVAAAVGAGDTGVSGPASASAAATQAPEPDLDNDANIVNNSNITRVRVRTLCFDLGDLDTIEMNASRLLSHSADPGLVGSTGADASTARDRGASCSGASTLQQEGAAAATTGALPLPPSAYTHVLLVHNAGQVGDLIPLEEQGLTNIRRQTDLNVTSFAHLTAAVLRTFLNTPVVTPTEAELAAGQPQPRKSPPQTLADDDCRAGAMASPGAAVHAAGIAAGPSATAARASVHAAGIAAGPSATAARAAVGDTTSAGDDDDAWPAPPPPVRRAVTIVNISSVSVDQPYEHFSLYGMGKAARHMIIRSVAHEAALREAHSAAASVAAGQGTSTQGLTTARVRALSFAPGAIDTEMQASAREALPPGPLKARFEENARAGRLVDPRVSAQVLCDILTADLYDNGAHVDYYTAAAGGAGPSAAHPLARRA